MNVKEALTHYFGYTEFRPGQEETIHSILAGRHVIAMLPTGTGKSLCYQLPGYLLDGAVIIVSPLLSLMQDQVEQIRAGGEKRVVALNSFLAPAEKRQALLRLHTYKFIFISPEMLGTEQILEQMKRLNIAFVAIDEAHCISQWGYDFRPDYLKLGDVRQKLGNPLTLALTATATAEVRKDIAGQLRLGQWDEHVLSVDRPEIAISIEKMPYQEKLERMSVLATSLEGPGIIYFSSKKVAEQAAAILRNKDMRAMAYHGGLEHENRILIQQQFINGQLDVICATSAFGMGINKNNIRFIIHFHLPLQLESYLQEIGRAARDGSPSIAVLLYSSGDEQLSYQIAEAELPDEEQIEMLFRLIDEHGISPDLVPDHEELLTAGAGLTETQWRIAASFIADGAGESARNLSIKLQRFVAQRLRSKRHNIQLMMAYIREAGCKRTFILDYFSEPAKSDLKNCCSSCGCSYDPFISAAKNKSVQPKYFDWKRELASMLLTGNEPLHEK